MVWCAGCAMNVACIERGCCFLAKVTLAIREPYGIFKGIAGVFWRVK